MCELPQGLSSVLSTPVASVTNKPNNPAENYTWSCYTEIGTRSFDSHSFNLSSEDKESFSNFSAKGTTTPYLYNGITSEGDAVTEETMHVAHERYDGRKTSDFASYRSKSRRILYPPPAFAIYMDPMKGYKHAHDTIDAIVNSGYIDLQTKAVFVDATVYNADKDTAFYIRFLVEVGTNGGCRPSHTFYRLPKNFAQGITRKAPNRTATIHYLLALLYIINMCMEAKKILGVETEVQYTMHHIHALYSLHSHGLSTSPTTNQRLYLTVGESSRATHTHKCLQGTEHLFAGEKGRRGAYKVAAMYERRDFVSGIGGTAPLGYAPVSSRLGTQGGKCLPRKKGKNKKTHADT
jgi:hypothetical protein